MGRGWRTRLDVILPERVTLISGDRLPVRVVGYVLGFVRCAGERRFVWGKVDETFWVRAQKRLNLRVRASGLGGQAELAVQLRAKHQLARLRGVVPRPVLPRRRIPSPTVRGPKFNTHVPRVNISVPRARIEGLP